MKSAKLLLLLLLTLGFTACEDEEEEPQKSGYLNEGIPAILQAKWEVANKRELEAGNSESAICGRKVSQVDMYPKNLAVSCQDEYLYDFSDSEKAVIYAGRPSCSVTPTSTTKSFKFLYPINMPDNRQQLVIGEKQYAIVLLTKDTLILDYCTQTPTGLYQKNGIKLFRKE